MRVHWTHTAVEHLLSIYEHIAQDAPLYAQRMIDRLTQAQVAERMGIKPPAVTRLESSLSSGRHSPSITTLRKYAEAVGCRLDIHLVRDQS